jgi:hypothetical protein
MALAAPIRRSQHQRIMAKIRNGCSVSAASWQRKQQRICGMALAALWRLASLASIAANVSGSASGSVWLPKCRWHGGYGAGVIG